MERIAEFLKVSLVQYQRDLKLCFPDSDLDEAYQKIVEPKRATAGAAGYDFVTPLSITLQPGESVRIPTGIRVKMNNGWVLLCFPRSGLGFRYRLQLDNTTGIIDSDYFQSDNEGHILAQITNDSREGKSLTLKAGDRFMQGVFVPFGITIGDSEDKNLRKRNGGFGSTGL